jgi:26S proteasome regulatory subunit N5
MLALEKKCRQSGDSESTVKVAEAIVRAAFDVKDYEALNSVLALLSKRRGQFKRVILRIVGVATEYVERLPAKAEQLKLIDTLRAITEGKIFVENERARLTRQLARMKEAEGDLKAASALMQELQVETYNTMDRKEKTDYILEQMRLCLATNDFARCQIISRKISERLIGSAEFQQEKERYYRMMIVYYTNAKQSVDICRSYLSIYNTPSIKADEAKWIPALQKAVVFIILARYDNEQSDLSERIFADKALERMPAYKALLGAFLRKEITSWPELRAKYSDLLNREHPEVGAHGGWEALEKRVVEHNVRIIAQYYRQITLERMAQLLHQTREQTEQFVAELVNAKMIHAKIDRPRGIVVFRAPQNPMDLMENWSVNIKELLQKIDQVGHLVHRELVIHSKAQAPAAAEAE